MPYVGNANHRGCMDLAGFSRTSIGKKMVMAITGVILLTFVIAHMLGNLQIFLGQKALNDYAQHLKELPFLLWPARFVLLGALLMHLWLAFQLTLENRRAKARGYAVHRNVSATFASKTMMLTGLVILAFIIYHLMHFTFGQTNPDLFHQVDSLGRHDVYSMVVRSYQNIYISSAYLVAMFILCVHLSHGIVSFPQSLGLDTRKCQPGLKITARVVAWLIFVGNSSIPVAVLTGYLTLPAGT